MMRELSNKIKSLEDELSMALGDNFKPDEKLVLPSSGKTITQRDFIIACAKIGVLLAEQKACLNQLKKFEFLLQSKAKLNTNIKVNLLRTTLESELARFGFHPKFGKAYSYVEPDVFSAAIREGLLLKDASAGVTPHGEFTHALQWLIIAYQQEEIDFLGVKLIDLFKLLGSSWAIFPKPVDGTDNLWDMIVDHVRESIEVGFRCPDTLSKFIVVEKADELPVTAALLTKRFLKRLDNMQIKKVSLFVTEYQTDKKADVYNPGENNIRSPVGFKKKLK